MGRKKPGRKAEPKRGLAWPRWTGFRGKTFWDWLQLLVIPFVLLGVGIALDIRQQGIEDRRAKREHELEEQRAQDTALQAYLDQMSQLMLENNLRDGSEHSEARRLASARTLTVLQSLDDPQRKKSVLRFLYEADLIDRPQPIVSLEGANLQGINLENGNLSGGPFLQSPHLRRCKLVVFGAPGSLFGDDHADLSGANLTDTDLRDAFLSGVDLKGANLNGADLRRVMMLPDFHEAKQTGWRVRTETDCATADTPIFGNYPHLPEGAVATNLEGASLAGTKIQNADLRAANLRGSRLVDANLSDAKLDGADLQGSNLDKAILEGASLIGANLEDASVKDEQLKEAKSLAGATMPDGTIKARSLEGSIGPNGTLSPGRYTSVVFEPALSFSVSDGSWRLSYPATTDALSIEVPELGQLNFTSPRSVFDQSNLGELKGAPPPETADEWVSWFKKHPNLHTSNSAPFIIGDIPGMRIDVTYDRALFYPRDLCGEHPCVPLFSIGDSAIVSSVGYRNRFVIVDTGSQTLVIAAGAPADNFDEFLPKAQKVLDSVEVKDN